MTLFHLFLKSAHSHERYIPDFGSPEKSALIDAFSSQLGNRQMRGRDASVGSLLQIYDEWQVLTQAPSVVAMADVCLQNFPRVSSAHCPPARSSWPALNPSHFYLPVYHASHALPKFTAISSKSANADIKFSYESA